MSSCARIVPIERLGAAVERAAVQDHVAGPHEGEDGGRDRRHAGREHETVLGLLVDGEPVLDDLEVRVVEAGVDEARLSFPRRLAPARRVVEVVAAFLGGAEHEGRGQEHRRLDRAFGQGRVVAVAEHQGFGMQRVIADADLVIARAGHDQPPIPPRRQRGGLRAASRSLFRQDDLPRHARNRRASGRRQLFRRDDILEGVGIETVEPRPADLSLRVHEELHRRTGRTRQFHVMRHVVGCPIHLP